MKIFTRLVMIPCWLIAAIALPAFGHIQLAKPLKKRYQLRTVSCAACHTKEPKKKTRDKLTDFGEQIAKILAGKMVSDRIAATKGASSEERKATLGEIEKEYLKALEKLDEMIAPSGAPYSEALPGGEIEGTKPR